MRSEPPDEVDTVADVGEFDLIARVTDGRAQPASTLLGPGDD
ncbi:MAG TPA: thiamine-phosphate kinase, partial [Pseudonocardiaceae bacterium]